MSKRKGSNIFNLISESQFPLGHNTMLCTNCREHQILRNARNIIVIKEQPLVSRSRHYANCCPTAFNSNEAEENGEDGKRKRFTENFIHSARISIFIRSTRVTLILMPVRRLCRGHIFYLCFFPRSVRIFRFKTFYCFVSMCIFISNLCYINIQ